MSGQKPTVDNILEIMERMLWDLEVQFFVVERPDPDKMMFQLNREVFILFCKAIRIRDWSAKPVDFNNMDFRGIKVINISGENIPSVNLVQELKSY